MFFGSDELLIRLSSGYRPAIEENRLVFKKVVVEGPCKSRQGWGLQLRSNRALRVKKATNESQQYLKVFRDWCPTWKLQATQAARLSARPSGAQANTAALRLSLDRDSIIQNPRISEPRNHGIVT